jgi:nitrate reductase delta subunit
MKLRHRRWAGQATTLKLCSLLLQYPDQQILEARADLLAAANELPDSPAASALRRFGEWCAAADPWALRQHYVHIFDLDKRCGLYLTFYGEGDRR